MPPASSTSSLPLAALPLRPSTLTLLQQRGFVTLGELMESKESGSGLATLAAELQITLPKAMRLLREIQDCLTASAADSPVPGTAIATATATASNINISATGSTIDVDKENHQQPRASETVTPEAPFILTPPPMMTASDLLAQLHPPRSAGRSESSRRNQSATKGGSGGGGSDSDGSSSRAANPCGIITFCRSIDTLLFAGGIPLGSVTEFAGLPGVGKTQLAMQLAVNARLPTMLGGVQGQTLYIDAEGSLVPERLHTMAQALLHHTQGTLRRRRQLHTNCSLPFHFSKVEQILEGIHIFRVHDEASQTATLYSLPYWIDQINKNSSNESEKTPIPVKLIVIDSIAFHYRTKNAASKDFYLHRTRALTQLAAFLNDIARDFNVAVVCLNQMTTKIDNNKSRLVPALGESWAHAVTTRFLLSRDDRSSSHRVCTLVKSPCMPSWSAFYQVTESGIRDVPPLTVEVAQNNDEGKGLDALGATAASQSKRLRTD